MSVKESPAASSASSIVSESSYRPLSPTSPDADVLLEPSAKRRKSFPANHNGDRNAFALPPPPTRTRKIIQMKPKPQEQQSPEMASPPADEPRPTPKKKNTGSAAGAGRKIARKTAHSLIERRRRSKMNEEFGVLKDMIPACAGQDMHKLAILQASIEYMRYLEQCVADLKVGNRASVTSLETAPFRHGGLQDGVREAADGNASKTSPPAMHPLYRNYPHDLSSTTSLATEDPRDYYRSPTSTHTSPTSIAQRQETRPMPYVHLVSPHLAPGSDPSPSIAPFAAWQSSADPSPILLPRLDSTWSEDHEATTALLMLGSTDRRVVGAKLGARTGRRGMSVKDLLST